MGILRDFENRLERIVEGFFSRAFRSGLQPVELAKRILREMDAAKSVGVREVRVPNSYTVHLSPDDHEQLAGAEHTLAKELENVVTEGARERGYGLIARPEVTFEVHQDLRRGNFRIESEMAEETGPPPADVGPRPPGSPVLALVENGEVLREYALARETMTIGRMEGSEIEVKDPGASRRHAEVRREGDSFRVIDLGSTNGTQVNGRRVKEHQLGHGDRITIGRTTLEFRSE